MSPVRDNSPTFEASRIGKHLYELCYSLIFNRLVHVFKPAPTFAIIIATFCQRGFTVESIRASNWSLTM